MAHQLGVVEVIIVQLIVCEAHSAAPVNANSAQKPAI